MRYLRLAFSLVLAAIAACLLAGGVRLLSLGGSAYYLVAGLLVLASAGALWRGSWRAAATTYGLLLLVTYGWAVWEVGLDGWALAPRVIAPTVLGIAFLVPWIKRRPVVVGLGLAAVAAGVSLWAATLPGPGIEPVAKASPPTPIADRDWGHYGGDAGGQRFSPLAQIAPENVAGLKVAWTYRLGPPPDGVWSGQETTPIKVGDTLYLCDSANVVHALDAETGRRRWRFDPKVNITGATAIRACRGVAYHETPNAAGPCARRILAATVDARLLALDAGTGRPCAGFGKDGVVDLAAGMGEIRSGYYYVTSAPTVVRGKAVVGGWVVDNQEVGEPSGVVRAFDAVTGAFAWAFDAGRPEAHGEPPPGQTYTRGSPNSWAPMSVDEALGLIFVPTGNATPDYFGAHRSAEAERYASAVVALDGDTGAPRWAFQTVHHDLWDYDVGAQPTLLDLPGGVPAVIAAGKSGQIFLLDRRDGRPIAPVAEIPVPQGAVPGERLSPTQPVSSLPSANGPPLTERAMWGLTPLDQLWCRIEFRKARYDGPMTPPQTDRPTINAPGYMGGLSWGGVSVDPERRLMVVNANLMASFHRLLPRKAADEMGVGPRGTKGAKPSPGVSAMAGTPYAAVAKPFLSPIGVPCQQPPYGQLSVVDLDTRAVLWRQPLGTARDSGAFGLRLGLPIPMGLPNFGGALTTRSGLIFIAAAQEQTFRAVDLRTGRILWSDRLPAGGQATPMTYVGRTSGRQFVVLAAGGKTLLQTGMGDYVIAYALPAAGS
jgi:quinoprotein glucose dehydrogenase